MDRSERRQHHHKRTRSKDSQVERFHRGYGHRRNGGYPRRRRSLRKPLDSWKWWQHQPLGFHRSTLDARQRIQSGRVGPIQRRDMVRTRQKFRSIANDQPILVKSSQVLRHPSIIELLGFSIQRIQQRFQCKRSWRGQWIHRYQHLRRRHHHP